MRAGLTEARALEHHVAHADVASEHVVQRHAERDDVPPVGARVELDALGLDRGERLALDQRHLAAGAGPVGEGACLQEITVALEASP